MTVRKVEMWPSEVLCTKAKEVEDFDSEEFLSLVEDMKDTMIAHRAEGLAAPQIRKSLRVIAFRDPESNEPRVLVNPEITSSSGEVSSTEGCLSFPGVVTRISRSDTVSLTAYDPSVKNEIEVEFEGLPAVAIQHEIDHLNGVTMLDHMGRLERKMAKKRLKKLRKRFGL